MLIEERGVTTFGDEIHILYTPLDNLTGELSMSSSLGALKFSSKLKTDKEKLNKILDLRLQSSLEQEAYEFCALIKKVKDKLNEH